MNVTLLDTFTRTFWFITHFIGFVYIIRCWRIEKKNFYLWFAASWLMMAARAFSRLTLESNSYVHIIGSVLISPASSICGLIAFRYLFQYVSRRVVTIRPEGDGVYSVRTFQDYHDPEGDRTTPILPFRRSDNP